MRCALLIWRRAYSSAPTAEEFEADSAAHGTFIELLRREGANLSFEVLKPPAQAATIQQDGDSTIVTDGPFIDLKEHVAGIYLFDAPDRDTAIRWAQACPNYGRNELRPVWDLQELEADATASRKETR